MIVLRHDTAVDVAAACEQQTEVVAALLAGCTGRPDLLASLFQASLRLSGLIAARDSDAPELDAALRTTLDAAIALFETATTGRFDGVIGEKRVRIEAQGTVPGGWPGAHRLALGLATVLRDEYSAQTLAAIPASVLSGRSGDPLDVAWDRAVSATLRRRPEAVAVVAAAMRLAEERGGSVGIEAVADLTVWRALADRDAKELNRALPRALDDHRRRWSHRDVADDALGFVAFGPLAAAAAAHDRGLRVEVQSDYLPLRLILGDLDRDTAGLSPEPGTTDSGGATFTLCPLCGSSIGKRHRSCPTCRNELAHAEPLVMDLPQLALLPRVSCTACGEAILEIASICPRCRAWQEDADGSDEISLRAFPAEYALYASSRPFVPARFALLLPLGAPSIEEIAARLPISGHTLRDSRPVRVFGATYAWVEDVEVYGPDGLVRARLAPVPIDQMPGFDRGDLGKDAGPVREALRVEAALGPDLLLEFGKIIRFLHAIAPEAAGLFDLDAGVVRSASWLRDIARNPIPPDPNALYAVRTEVRGGEAWIYTAGLLRCGVFELEGFGIPPSHTAVFADLIDATARVLIDAGDALPSEESPIGVGPVRVCWVPTDWALDRRAHLVGVQPEDRVGRRGLSAAVLAWDGVGPGPLEGLAHRLEGFVPPLSLLDLAHERAVARVTLGRLAALRRVHGWQPGVQFLLKMSVGGADDPLASRWFRMVDLGDREASGLLLGEPYRDLARGALVRAPIDAVLGWEVEWAEGRVDSADALAEIVAEVRRADYLERSEGAATPIAPPPLDGAITATPTPPRAGTPRPPASPPPVSARGAAPPVVEVLELSPPTATERSRKIAVLLSLVLPGAGHAYLGDPRRGAAFFGFGLVTLFLFGFVNVVAAYECWSAPSLPPERGAR